MTLLVDTKVSGIPKADCRGPRLHQPIRLLLTGRADGAPISDLVQLLEMAQWEGPGAWEALGSVWKCG